MPEDESYYPETDSGESDTEETSETSILPVSFFQGKELEPGKKCEVEVVAVYGDEVEVRYVEHDGKKDRKERDDDEDEEMVMVEEE